MQITRLPDLDEETWQDSDFSKFFPVFSSVFLLFFFPDHPVRGVGGVVMWGGCC